MRGIMIAAAVSILVLAGRPALADCAADDIDGQWDWYSYGRVVDRGDFTFRCVFTIESGSVSGRCRNQFNVLFNVLEGDMAVRPNCRMQGTLVFQRDGESGSFTFRIPQSTMQPDKGGVAGVTGITGPASSFTMFQMVRR